MAFRQAQAADLRADFSTRDEQFDIGVGKIIQNVRESRSFSYDELAYYWKSQAAGKFVCITLNKNNLEKDERNKLVSRLSEYLFKCGVRRVRIHQGYGAGVGVLFDQERK